MSQKTANRDSNMELYRIVAMLTVMFFHVCGEIDIIQQPLSNYPYVINLFFTSATFICVDMFVLLSGWYGINTRWEKVKSLVFQVLFYSVSLYLIMLLCCPEITFSWNFLIHVLIMDDYWFVPVYLMLYLFAPAINPFIKQSSKQQFLIVLLAIIIMQTIYGWLNYRESGYMEGCSPISFLILYLLGAYLRRIYTSLQHISKRTLLLSYLSLITINWILALSAKHFHQDLLLQLSWQFSSPIIIAAAACILLLFSKIDIPYNKTINWVAASSFAAFLIHCFPLFYDNLYKVTVSYIYTQLPLYLSVPSLILFVLILFVSSILIDQIRLFIYRKITNLA